MEDLDVVIGHADAEIRMRPLDRSYPGVTDVWDGNWIDARISVRAGAFGGTWTACLRAQEFRDFRRDLERLYQDLRGVGGFQSLEAWLDLRLEGDGRGHFGGPVVVRDRAGDGNRLEFDLVIDQSEMPPIIAALRSVESEFPVIGDSG